MVSSAKWLVLVTQRWYLFSSVWYGNIFPWWETEFLFYISSCFLSLCFVCGPLFSPIKSHLLFPSISSSVWPHFVCLLSFSQIYFTGSQRYRIVREPIFISVFLFYTQTQVTKLCFLKFHPFFPVILHLSHLILTIHSIAPPSISPNDQAYVQV